MANLFLAGWLLYVGIMPVSFMAMEHTPLVPGSVPSREFEFAYIQRAEFDFYIGRYARFYTGIEIRETKADLIFFAPYRGDFNIGLELFYRDFIAGARHECDHDIVIGSGLTPNNGLDGAFCDIYLAWRKSFPALPRLTLTPAVQIAWQPKTYFNVKPVLQEHYFDYISMFYTGDNTLYVRAALEADFFDFFRLSFAVRPDFSAPHGEWSSISFETGVEARYGGTAIGAAATNRFRLGRGLGSGYTLHELHFYVSFRGTSPLFPR
ncbi:MAG: hypothetical protein LBC88_10360 [Spirochaetaceae bacterium]|nr:hypothetical protein [Spirochaetaceae bacterium]